MSDKPIRRFRYSGTDEQLINALRAMPIRGGISGQVVAEAAAYRIEQLEAQLAAADELEMIAELLLRMMDDVIKPTGRGDMAIVPDGSVTVIGAWKVLAAYRKARGAGQ